MVHQVHCARLQDPPPGKVKNSGGVRAKKARCSLAMESTKKLTTFFFWSFFKQNGTKLEAKLHFFRISSFIGLELRTTCVYKAMYNNLKGEATSYGFYGSASAMEPI